MDKLCENCEKRNQQLEYLLKNSESVFDVVNDLDEWLNICKLSCTKFTEEDSLAFLNKVDNTIGTNKSMTSKQLEEYLNDANSNVFQPYNPLEDWKLYLGKCPHCGSTNIEANYDMVLTSMPLQYNCRCKNCGGTFYSSQIKQESQTITPYAPDPGLPSYPSPGLPSYSDQPQKPDYGYGGSYGWICPKCGKVNAPHINFCDCSSGKGWDIVWCNSEGTSAGKPNIMPSNSVSASQDSSKLSIK